jgi:DNA-binding MarR family transcriptional regulator
MRNQDSAGDLHTHYRELTAIIALAQLFAMVNNILEVAIVSAVADTETIHQSIAQLQRLAELFQQRRQQLARRAGLSEQQWRVLEEISTEHFIPSMFARSRESSAAAVSKVLRLLLDKELVRVSVSESDGRHRTYELSAKGQRTLERLRRDRQHAIETIWSDLPVDELRRFNQLGAELIARIERYASQEEPSGRRERVTRPASVPHSPTSTT